MKLTNKFVMSQWTLYQCLEGNDTQEMRDLITESFFNYMYYRNIKDREEMWNKINNPKRLNLMIMEREILGKDVQKNKS